jgi:hypothetical protein
MIRILATVAALAPRWLIPPLFSALWIASYAVRDEIRRMQMPRQWDR